MDTIRWERYPLVADLPTAHAWLTIQAYRGLAPNTVQAYASALQDYLGFCHAHHLDHLLTTPAHIARYIHHLRTRLHPRPTTRRTGRGLSDATIQQRLTAVHLYYRYLVEEGQRRTSPVQRAVAGAGTHRGQARRGLVPRSHRLPWIPSDAQWHALLAAVRTERMRNRVMFALAYDAGLRREELCSLRTDDLDPARRFIRIRAEVAKNHRERVVPYSAATSTLYVAYLHERRAVSRHRGSLFLSESRRNWGQPISIWTWSKVIAGLAARAQVPQFTTHSLRHLCLTDLARAGWDIHEIAAFAGHRTIQTTLRYIHVSGRDLATKLEQGMATIHAWRTALLGEVLR